ncbi:DUF4190 domain-containing protein [Streptomyces chartreusis]|uniref:DUF4190 domain-containing protein n=2 Tax=Streptomyces TaxID=1883 RepID=UPI0036873B18
MSDDAQTPEAPEVSGEGSKTSLDKQAAPSRPAEPAGPGHTLVSNDTPAWAAPSVHDQRTVTSMPAAGAAGEPQDAVPAPRWVNPSPAPQPATHSATDPFAPPGATPANPFVPPTVSVPYAAHGEPVPPPPIAPDGPGQVPYGYPGGAGYPTVGTGGAGYPAPGPGGPGYPAPGPGGAGYYGWPGMHPMPSNGMGTAGLVLGIISAVIFCLWPVAIVVGVLAVIFGAIGRGKARRGEATNPGQALAGIICGAAGVALGLGMLVLVVATNM